MAELQKQALDIKLLGLDEKANPREAIPGTLTTLENCVMFKDGRVQKRAGLSALSMTDNIGATITNARELTSHKGQLLLNDGNRWYQRHPVTGAWTRKGYSAYERLDMAPLCSTFAECDGTDSRLQMDSATIGRYGLVVMCGTDIVTGNRESGWYLYDRTTGSVLVRKQPLMIQDPSVCTDGAATESFVIFAPAIDVTEAAKYGTLNAYVLGASDGYSTVQATGAVVSDMSWSSQKFLTFDDSAPARRAACFEVLRVGVNTWLLAYHQYKSDGGDHSHLVVRTITRTTGATFTVSDAAEVAAFADQDAGCISWAYRSGAYAHLAWEVHGDDIYSSQITIADRTVGASSSLGFGYWTSCRGIAGDVIGTQPYFIVDYYSSESDPHLRYLYLWQVGVDYSLLLRDAGLLTKAFQVENQLSNEIGIGVFVASAWQPSAFLLRVRVDGHDAIGSTVGAHLCAGDFAGRDGGIKLSSANGGAFFPVGKLVNPSSLAGSGTVNVTVASVRNPLVVSATPTTTAYATQAQPIEVAGTAMFPGAALKQFDGESVCEAAFYLAPDWISPTEGGDDASMEIGTRYYTAVARWTDAQGRIQRSAPCPPVSVTTTDHHVITVEHPWLHLTERCSYFNYNTAIPNAVIEFYRTPVNSPIFYLVNALTNTPNAVAASFTDDTPDADITGNEQLYTTGETVQNWPVIGCNAATIHQGRVFVLTAAGDVYHTGYLQDGEALTFAEEYELDTEHIPGTITAILSMDDKFVTCTDSVVASTTGLGPESNGLPPYDSPMVISSTLGPVGPRACVRIPDGIVMPTRHGIYLLNRGLSFQDIGPAVDTSAYGLIPGYAGAFHQTYKQVRIFGSGSTKTALAWDTGLIPPPNRSGQWMKWTHSIDVVATASAAGSLYYLGHNGLVYLSDSGTSDAGTAYQQSLQFSVLSPAGVNGWARIYKMRLAVDIATGCVLKAYLNPEEGNLNAAETWTYTAETPGKQHVNLKPRRGKLSSVTCWIGENAASTNAGFVLDALTLLVGNKGGLGRMPTASRMTRSA